MTKCPHCDDELSIPHYSFSNAHVNNTSNKVVTKCCGNLVMVTPLRTYRIEKYTGPAVVDDWGTEVGSLTEVEF